MLKKFNDYKINKYNLRKIVFLAVLALYAVGIAAGGIYAFKDSTNMKFISYIVGTDYKDNLENAKSISYYTVCAIKNILFLLSVYILKYAGILKGLCFSAPFVMGVQNSCVYSYLIFDKKLQIITLLKSMILKDVAVCMIISLSVMLAVCDIFYGKYIITTDLKRFSFLALAIIAVNFINRFINILF